MTNRINALRPGQPLARGGGFLPSKRKNAKFSLVFFSFLLPLISLQKSSYYSLYSVSRVTCKNARSAGDSHLSLCQASTVSMVMG
jgi:hypothetical protein